MKLQSGMPLLYQQYKALLRKNLVLAKRNMSYTLIKLFSSCFFLLLLFCIEKILKASSAGEAVVDPKPLVSPPIPPCEDKFHIKTPCFDFLWSGRGSAQIKNIVTGIMVNNPGRPIPSKKVCDFLAVWILVLLSCHALLFVYKVFCENMEENKYFSYWDTECPTNCLLYILFTWPLAIVYS